MRDILREIGAAMGNAENRISLSGHTDAAPYGNADRGYSNWELSADRANASRRELVAAGMPVESDAPLPTAPVLDGTFRIDPASSVIRWTGQNLFNHHEGTLMLAEGLLQIARGMLVSGEFAIDMNTIVCTDLVDPAWNAMLVRHLRSADFFQVDDHPTARFVMDASTPVAGATEGVPNYQIGGHLTLRGVTRPLEFPAVIAAADAGHVTAQAHLSFDRTQFGSGYGSGRLFAFLGKHVVNDHIQLHLKLHAVMT